ncbi:MAG: hypothetical protein M9894_30540 [Planctomycetes bacterium]|nr:hypothetical protein [Planctomycetota bacterium]
MRDGHAHASGVSDATSSQPDDLLVDADGRLRVADSGMAGTRARTG